jgi:hypothetical protein
MITRKLQLPSLTNTSAPDVDVAAADLIELGSSEYHPYFIKRLVSVATFNHPGVVSLRLIRAE